MNDAHRWELEWLRQHTPAPLAPLDEEEQARVESAFADAVDQWLERAAAHAELIKRTARRLGVEVAQHRVTVADADRRLELLAAKLDTECPALVTLVPYDQACAIARESFRAAYHSSRRRVP